MEKRLKTRYGHFALTAALYIAGVIIFSLWSYTAHRAELLGYVDKSLTDAAYSIREIISPEMIRCQKTEPDYKHPEALQACLSRMTSRGRLAGIGTAHIHGGHVDLLLAEPVQAAGKDDQVHADLQSCLERELIQLAAACSSESGLITLNSPVLGRVRAAVVFLAGEPGEGFAFFAAQQRRMIEQELAAQKFRLTAAAIGMLILAVPLIVLYSRSQKETAANLTLMNERLQRDMDLQKTREQELKDAISDLERFSSVAAGRESRIIELKSEVNKLLEELNRDKRYNIDKID